MTEAPNVAAGYARIRDHAFSVNGANIKLSLVEEQLQPLEDLRDVRARLSRRQFFDRAKTDLAFGQPSLVRVPQARANVVLNQAARCCQLADRVKIGCFRHQLLLPRPYLVLTKPLRLDIQCQRGASVKIGWKYLDD